MLLFGVDLRLDAADQHAYGNGIETSLRDDYVGVFLRRLDELLVHGLDCRGILRDDRLHGAPPLAYVAQDAAGEIRIPSTMITFEGLTSTVSAVRL